MNSEKTLVEVGDFASLAEAEVAKALLESQGLEVYMVTPGFGIATPELSVTDGVRLRVPIELKEKAEELLKNGA